MESVMAQTRPSGAGIGLQRLAISVSSDFVSAHPKRVECVEQVLHWSELS